MSEPTFHVVAFESLAQIDTIPQTMCCNCGGTVELAMRPARLTFSDPFGARSAWLRLHLPCCHDCRRTLWIRDPGQHGLLGITVLLATLWFFAAIAVVLGLRLPVVTMAAIVGLGTVSSVVAVHRWRTRPVGARVTNFQPVRFLGKDGTALATFFLSFANHQYATLVSDHCRQPGPSPEPAANAARLPRATIVSRHR